MISIETTLLRSVLRPRSAALLLLLASCSASGAPAASGPSPAPGGPTSTAEASPPAAAALAEDPAMATTAPPVLFDFADAETAGRFTTVDDRVMGGVSRSAMRAGEGFGVFAGVLSTESNGGFASVRAARSVDLSGRGGIALRVRGDGRSYQLRLRTDRRFDGISYRATFATTPETWTKVLLPFDAFQPTFRGRVPAGAPPLDVAGIESFGLMVTDAQVGEFRLDVATIGAF